MTPDGNGVGYNLFVRYVFMGEIQRQQEWQISDPDFSRLFDQLGQYDDIVLSYALSGERETFYQQFCDDVMEVTEGDDELLYELYVRFVEKLLDRYIEYLKTDSVLSMALSNEGAFWELQDLRISHVTKVHRILARLGFNFSGKESFVSEHGLGSSPLKKPFDNVSGARWEGVFEIAGNFAHALHTLIKLEAILSDLDSMRAYKRMDRRDYFDESVSHLVRCLRSLPGAAKLLEAFRARILGFDVRESCDMAKVLQDLDGMNCCRWLESWQASPFLVSCGSGLNLHNVNLGDIVHGLWEVDKNGPKKVSNPELVGYADEGECYQSTVAGKVNLRGGEFVVVFISDRGPHMDYGAIAAKYSQLGPIGLDVTMGDMIKGLSRLYESIPTVESREISSGRGLYVASRNFAENGGTMAYYNLDLPGEPNRGVECAVLIPVNGKESRIDVSDVTGVEIDMVKRQLMQQGLNFGPFAVTGCAEVSEAEVARLVSSVDEERSRFFGRIVRFAA